MLLRRFMRQLKRQDWMAVALEFVIVVFGVFFGLQVSEWNQARLDRAMERAYIARISRDIARSRAQIVELQHRIEPQFLDRTSPFVNYIQFLVQFDVQSPEMSAGATMTWDRMRIDLAAVCTDERFRASISAVRDMTFQIIAYNETIMTQMDAVTKLTD
ncbi:MAG: hypothetical protein ABMA15_13695 [Vicinamibacterales bacterium]